MKITQPILSAVERATVSFGNVSQLAKAMGIAHSTIFFWLKGKTTSMSGQLWQEKVRPVLAAFMTPEQLQEAGGAAAYTMHESPGVYRPLPGPGAQSRIDAANVAIPRHPIRVVPFSALKKLDPTVDSVPRFLRENNLDSILFSQDTPRGAFGVRLSNECESVFMPGTDLLVSPNAHPGNGSLVIARIRKTEEVVIRQYMREGECISLNSLVPGGSNYSWNRSDSIGYLLWLFPIFEAKIDLRTNARDEEEEED